MYNTSCTIPADLFNAGLYRVKFHFGIPEVKVLIPPKTYLEFSTILAGNHGSIYYEKWPGIVAPKLEWTTSKVTDIAI